MITIKPLNPELIARANSNSFGGKRGELEDSGYHSYCERAMSWNLSERKTQKIIDKIYDNFSRAISLDAQHVSVAVAGASNYNAKKLDRSEQILRNASDFCDWFSALEREATRTRYNRVKWLEMQVISGVVNDYSVNKEWRELASRDRNRFNAVYEKLIQKYEFKKTSIPYKIYNNMLNVEQISQVPIYSDDDFTAYEESDKLCIGFRMKPQRQLIVALKSRGFVWISAHEVWRAKSTADLKEWIKTIPVRYESYI